MARTALAVIQDDIARAFSVKAERLFHRRNAQVYAIVGCNYDLELVSDVWFDKFDTQAEFRAVLAHICALFRKGGLRYWLADLRFLKADFSESEDWLVREVMPAVLSAGLEREAVVLPEGAVKTEGEDIYATASRALAKIADGRVRSFTDIKLAKRWLMDGELPDA